MVGGLSMKGESKYVVKQLRDGFQIIRKILCKNLMIPDFYLI